MANTTKQAGKQPTPANKQAAPAKKPKEEAKSRVEEMFGGVQQPQELHIDTSVPLPEYADPDPKEPSAKDALDAVDAILSALGTDKFEPTVVPYAKHRNNGKAAADFVLWDHIKRFAEKRAKETEEVAAAQGVFGNPDNYVPGETSLIYQSPGFTISIKKGHDTKMVNKDQVIEVLKELKPERHPEYLERCMKPRAGPTQKIISLK